MDMGFTREQAIDALLNTSNLEEATEYILNRPPGGAGNQSMPLSVQRLLQQLGATDMEVGADEEEMIRAIAMSLGEDSTKVRILTW